MVEGDEKLAFKNYLHELKNKSNCGIKKGKKSKGDNHMRSVTAFNHTKVGTQTLVN